MNPLYRLRERVSSHADFIDLIITNYHDAGFRLPAEPLADAAARYFATARYRPDSRGLPEARETIAAYYSAAGTAIGPEEIILTASTSESYGIIFAALFRPGDCLFLPQPGYPLFEQIAGYHGLVCVGYPLLRSAAGWTIDREALEELVRRHRPEGIVVISPNNPTGAVFSRSDLAFVAGLASGEHPARPRGGRVRRVIYDEVFREFADLPVPRFADGDDTPVLYLNGVSKTFAAPDLKLAWIACRGPGARQAAELLSIVNDAFLDASALSQYLVPVLFERLEEARRTFSLPIADRRRLVREIAEGHPELGIVAPAGGIHFTAAPRSRPELDDEELAMALLDEAHVFAHPGYLYGEDERRLLIMACLGSAHELTEGLRRLAAL